MADSNFRNYRSRDAAGYDDPNGAASERLRDPLAELARLIGQGDPANEFERSPRREPALPVDEMAPAAEPEWADDQGYAEQGDYAQNQYTDENYIQPRLADPYPRPRDDERAPLSDSRYPARDDRYDDPRAYGHRDEPAHDRRYRDEAPPSPQSAGRRLPALPPQDYAEQYEDEEWQDDAAGGQYADEEYDDDAEPSPRRSGVVVIMAVLGLVIVGAASAFAYRAMFGGTILPTLPPIIKASDSPTKIVPPPAGGATPVGAPDTGAGEKLVPREEQPVQVQPTNPPPRVITTIPVSPAASASAVPAAPVAAPPDPGSVFPPPPAMAAAPAQPTAPPPVATPEPKKVHTVLIKPQQPGAGAPAPASAPPAQPRPIAPVASRPALAPVSRSSANAPLAIVPIAQGAAEPVPPPRTQIARSEPPPRSVAPAAASAGGGGYAVQVTSQRSEGEAKTAYEAIAAKFPKELGNRAPIIRRADLGAKGTYYRAMVGPFASSEAAAAMCSNLKAAGGSCLVQRE